MTERCNILSPMQSVNHRLLRFLSMITLAELVQPDSCWIDQIEGQGDRPVLRSGGAV